MNENVILSRPMAATVAIVGAGRVGRTLGLRLRQLGWNIGAVVTKSKATARSAVVAIGGGYAMAGIGRRVLDANVVIVATPDEAIGEVAAALARMGGEEWKKKIAIHTSGALDSSLLLPLKRCGAATGSFHPLQTFMGRNVPKLQGAVFTIEGDPGARRVARQMARALGGVGVIIPSHSKPIYHAGGTLAAGHGLALVEAAVRLLMRAGFSRRRAKMALLPMIRQMLGNFEKFGARKAWTGPLSRGDFSTLERHRRALAEMPAEFEEAYESLCRLAVRLLAPHPEATLRQLDHILPRH
jgi:predicted short-subunit dehydrogenase-like oxidoreductase (DUF2520 family)